MYFLNFILFTIRVYIKGTSEKVNKTYQYVRSRRERNLIYRPRVFPRRCLGPTSILALHFIAAKAERGKETVIYFLSPERTRCIYFSGEVKVLVRDSRKFLR